MIGEAELENYRKQFENWKIIHEHATIMVKTFDKSKTLIAIIIREQILSETPKLLTAGKRVLNHLERALRDKDKRNIKETQDSLESLFAASSPYGSLLTNYLKDAITHASAHYTQIEIQEEIIELKKFIAELPKELLTEDLAPSIKEVEDKIQAYRNADDKSGVVQKQNEKLIDEHALLIKQNKEAQAELAKNTTLLDQQKIAQSALEKVLPPLRKEEGDLRASLAQLTVERDALTERIGTLKKQGDILRVDADTANRNTEKTLEQGKITFVLDKFAQEIKKMKPQAQKIATTLHQALDAHAALYIKSHRTVQDKNDFIRSCRTSVDQVMPQLNDMGLGRKIQNLLIALWNAITPQSLKSDFFKTKSASQAEGTLIDLENIKGIK